MNAHVRTAGVGHASAMFSRGIRICTGTGIGAALSTCIQSPNWSVHIPHPVIDRRSLTSGHRFLIWVGSDQEKTFGPTITGLIKKHIEPERMILWDSKKRGGRPDTVQLLKDVWKSWNAEGKSTQWICSCSCCKLTNVPIVIFITSNLQGNTEMMEGCREGANPSLINKQRSDAYLSMTAGLHVFGTLWDF
jgi:hypothetical protein